jgi:DNA-binding NtrC family response regulator
MDFEAPILKRKELLRPSLQRGAGIPWRCLMKKKTILVLKGQGIPGDDFKILLKNLGFEVIQGERETAALILAARRDVDLVVITASGSEDSSEIDIVRHIKRISPSLPVFLAARNGSKSHAVASFRAGVADYIDYPCSAEEFLQSIEASLPQKMEISQVSGPMVGESKPMREISRFIHRVAATDSTVLITGETGTGKELVASLIHQKSRRRAKPFVCVNCAAMPDTLVESEMFGYERGAFTGAVSARLGKFEVANGGTVFLDEISDMTPFAQAKLLRTIESKELYRLGGRKVIPLDVRVTAATNEDPEELISEGKFREDLYYRLNIARIHLPPLRERKEDIRKLIAHGIDKLNEKYGRNVRGLSAEAMVFFMRYDWPGNVRELLNLLEATFINLPQKQIAFADLPRLFQQKLRDTENVPLYERKKILSALLETKWNKTEAARKLNWSRMTLYRKITKYNIVEQSERPDARKMLS